MKESQGEIYTTDDQVASTSEKDPTERKRQVILIGDSLSQHHLGENSSQRYLSTVKQDSICQ